jgi:hypothetical protein
LIVDDTKSLSHVRNACITAADQTFDPSYEAGHWELTAAVEDKPEVNDLDYRI